LAAYWDFYITAAALAPEPRNDDLADRTYSNFGIERYQNSSIHKKSCLSKAVKAFFLCALE
jgi:hypothetical protein